MSMTLYCFSDVVMTFNAENLHDPIILTASS